MDACSRRRSNTSSSDMIERRAKILSRVSCVNGNGVNWSRNACSSGLGVTASATWFSSCNVPSESTLPIGKGHHSLHPLPECYDADERDRRMMTTLKACFFSLDGDEDPCGILKLEVSDSDLVSTIFDSSLRMSVRSTYDIFVPLTMNQKVSNPEQPMPPR